MHSARAVRIHRSANAFDRGLCGGGRDDFCTVVGEDGVERCGELAVSVTDEEPEAPSPVAEVHEQVAGELSDPCAGWVGGDTQDMDASGLDLHDEEDVEAFEEDGLHVHEIASEQRVSL